MKITKAKLKQIIKEELEGDYRDDPNQLAPAAAAYKQELKKKASGLLRSLDQVGKEVNKAHQMAGDPAMVQSLEMIDGLITKLYDEMSDLLM